MGRLAGALGWWIGILCNLLVFSRAGASLTDIVQRKTAADGLQLDDLLMHLIMFTVLPLPVLPLVGALFCWDYKMFGADERAKNKAEWGLLLCLIAPFLHIFLVIYVPVY